MKEVLIDIDKNGNPTIEGIGFVGAECKQFTKALEEELGTVAETKLKPEYARGHTVLRKVGA